MKNKIRTFFFSIFFCIFLISCHAIITKANFDKIQVGMTIQEVIAILGKPTSSSTLSFGDVIGTSANWENRNGVISVQFFNGKVKIKRFIEGVSTPRVP